MNFIYISQDLLPISSKTNDWFWNHRFVIQNNERSDYITNLKDKGNPNSIQGLTAIVTVNTKHWHFTCYISLLFVQCNLLSFKLYSEGKSILICIQAPWFVRLLFFTYLVRIMLTLLTNWRWLPNVFDLSSECKLTQQCFLTIITWLS